MADNNIIEIKFSATGDDKVVKAIEALDKSTKKLIEAQVQLTGESKKQKNSNKAHENSVRRLEIKLQALGFSFKQAGISTKMQKEASKGNRLELEKMRIATKKFIATQKQADVSTRILGGSLAVLRSKLLIYNFAMALGIRQTLRFAEQASRVESMERAFNTLSGGVTSSEQALRKLQKATDGTMDRFNLFQQANNAMILGVSRNSDEMAEMFDIAQRLGRALGRDTASSVESLITGIGRQSRLMLDNIGIIVKADEAYESYAKELGTTADKLTDADKKQAFLNATMESARKKVEDLGDEFLTTQDHLDSFKSSFSDLSSTIGENLPFFDAILQRLSRNAKIIEGAIKPQDDITKATERYTKAEQALAIAINGREEARRKRKDEKIIKAYENEIKAQRIIRDSNLALINSLIEINDVEQKIAKDKEEKIKQEEEASRIKNEIAEEEVDIAEKILKKVKLFDKAKETIFKGTVDYQLNQLKILEDNFLEFGVHNLESEAYFAEQRKKIVKEQQDLLDQQHQDKLDKLQEERDARFEMANFIKNQAQNLLGFHADNVQKRKDNAIKALKDSDEYERASSEKRKTMEKEVNKSFAEEEKRLFEMKKLSSLADIAMNTAKAISKFAGNPVMMGIVSAIGAMQAGVVMSQEAPKYEQGGLVGGNRHSQGGTLIEAERGEFVMSRNAVESIGAETLNQMNQSGATGVTVNISAPLVDDTVVDRIIPAIQLALNEDRASLKI